VYTDPCWEPSGIPTASAPIFIACSAGETGRPAPAAGCTPPFLTFRQTVSGLYGSARRLAAIPSKQFRTGNPMVRTIRHRETVGYDEEISAGLNLPQRHPLHCARDHWAVRAARAGTPVAVIQAQLGHGSPMLTLTKYVRTLGCPR